MYKFNASLWFLRRIVHVDGVINHNNERFYAKEIMKKKNLLLSTVLFSVFHILFFNFSISFTACQWTITKFNYLCIKLTQNTAVAHMYSNCYLSL